MQRRDKNGIFSRIYSESVLQMYVAILPSEDPGGDSMKNGEQKRQLQLLLFAIGNVIDQNPVVEHISYGEIWAWLNDILGMEE
jgi:hypothetical protein